MMRSDDLHSLPTNLPVPPDDGVADHLAGMPWPDVALSGTHGDRVRFAGGSGTSVVYAYPRTGRPDQNPPLGWNEIPGARGCTPESCGFRDHHETLVAQGIRVFGLSAQPSEEQREAVERLGLPFPLLSDARHELADALQLPTFEVAGMRLLKRLTLILRDGVIEHVFYPVFPPDLHAAQVVEWFASQRRRAPGDEEAKEKR